MKKIQSGFSLIELMIAVAIIGILAVIALPVYQNYTKRAYIIEGLSLASGAKAAVSEYYSAQGRWPVSNVQVGLDNANNITGESVNSVVVQPNGEIAVIFNERVRNNEYLVLVANTSGGSIIWECTPGTLDNTYLPIRCRDRRSSEQGEVWD